ncbi:MAG: sporulation protein YqfD [Firmicutes bacterium]|nr:sporulation protein YqfD [Bacillota bacterium]
MLIRGLWSYYKGYVIIKVKGRAIEEFLNRASQHGIYLWNVERLSRELLVARLSVVGFEELVGLVSLLPITVEIRQQVGLPFLWQRLRERSLLMIGAMISLICIYLLSSIVWFIQIQGAETLDQALIKETLKSNGVQVGVPRSAVDPRGLEKQLMLELPQLAWVGIGLKGTLLAVEVVEKAEITGDEKLPGDIIAGKAALVTQIIPFAGQVLVQEGETVTPGQVLIDGSLPEYGLLGQGGEERYMRAAGVIKGRVWYKGFGEASVIRYTRHRTGESCKGYYLNIGAWRRIFGVSKPPYKLYEESKSVRRMYWERLQLVLPVYLDVVEYYELVEEKTEIDLEVAKEMALRYAWQDIERKITPRTEILSQETELVTEERDGEVLVRVKRVVEVHEEIGVFRPVQDQAGAVGEGSY